MTTGVSKATCLVVMLFSLSTLSACKTDREETLETRMAELESHVKDMRGKIEDRRGNRIVKPALDARRAELSGLPVIT